MYIEWHSRERDKYIWEDLYAHSWDEIIGRMYLLKAHSAIEQKRYKSALGAFQQALALLSQNDVSQDYYPNTLADQALVQCILGKYRAALNTTAQALKTTHKSDRIIIEKNHATVLALSGAFSKALDELYVQLQKDPEDMSLRFIQGTCLLRLERYDEAIAAYEQVFAKEKYLYTDEGLKAARKHEQPDWDNL